MEKNLAGLIKDAWFLVWAPLFSEGLEYGGGKCRLGARETGVEFSLCSLLAVSVSHGNVPIMYIPTVYLSGWCSHVYLTWGCGGSEDMWPWASYLFKLSAPQVFTLMWVEPVWGCCDKERYPLWMFPSTVPGFMHPTSVWLLLNCGFSHAADYAFDSVSLISKSKQKF